jgi:peroxiredoxin
MKIKIILITAIFALITFGFTITNNPTSSSVNNTTEKGFNIGQTAPEISLPNAEGKSIKLSDLRGQVVLIDFWASWCRPCRMENPHVLKAYNNYKDKNFTKGKGFTVYGVSLDRSADQWKKAIKSDQLVWNSNVLGNQDVAQQYGVRSIPSNFLLDADGVVIATNLRGEALENKLESLLK